MLVAVKIRQALQYLSSNHRQHVLRYPSSLHARIERSLITFLTNDGTNAQALHSIGMLPHAAEMLMPPAPTCMPVTGVCLFELESRTGDVASSNDRDAEGCLTFCRMSPKEPPFMYSNTIAICKPK